MKRIFFALFAALLTVSALTLTALAADGEESRLPDEVLSEYGELVEAIPDGVRDELPSGLASENTDEIAGAVEEMLEPSFLLSVVWEAVGLHIGDALSLLARLFGILILSAVFRAVQGGMQSGALGRVTATVSSAVLLSAITMTQSGSFLRLSEYFSELSTLAGGMIPVMGVLYALGGNLSGAATGSAAMSIFLAVSEFVGGQLLFPTVGACIALAIVPVFAKGLNLRSVSAFIKRTFTFCLGFLMMLLSALLAMRSGLAARADSVGARTVKYVASSMIPVVGGSVADSLRTVGASVEYLRTTIGIAGILLIVLLLIPVLVELLITRFCLILAGSAAEMLGCDGEARLLSEMTGVYGYILAVAVMCAVMFVFALTIFVRTAVAI